MSISAKIGWVVFILDMVLLFVCALVICAIVLLAKDGSKAQAILNKMKLTILSSVCACALTHAIQPKLTDLFIPNDDAILKSHRISYSGVKIHLILFHYT